MTFRSAVRDGTTLHCRAPAKINLVLRVLDCLPNGYHEIWSLMQAVDVTDEIIVRVDPNGSGISLRCNDPRLPIGAGNLAYRAAHMVIEKADRQVGVQIDVVKRIPIGAGLGGGSSDAATVMMALVNLLELGWSEEMMIREAAGLGSDVPFFVKGPSAVVRGWGQEIHPLTLKNPRWVVLVTPPFSIQTGWAYLQLDRARSAVTPLSPRLTELQSQSEVTWDALRGLMENDFESALWFHYPDLRRIKVALLDEGAEAALLSGSGSTVFGVFTERERAEQAVRALKGRAAHVALARPWIASGLEMRD
ncbi:MAG: 4-(cytidine 5'-diphospho)-2-C-methyl-D-erythritol kinase [Nitrospirae bacterium]|nr:MAG: 4-(cytidine 5'-diphospho)-2-C-methyl-D-erythritol kinase [Nitrospirota bacterium]